MNIEIREESRKIIYKDGIEVAQFKQNGVLKLQKTSDVGYGELEELFEQVNNIPVHKV